MLIKQHFWKDRTIKIEDRKEKKNKKKQKNNNKMQAFLDEQRGDKRSEEETR